MDYIDLSRVVQDDIPVWPGDDPVKLKQVIKHDFIVDNKLETGMHIGTHIDAPIHMIEGGKSLAKFSPETFIGRGVLLDARNLATIGVEHITLLDLRPGDILLSITGSDRKYGTPAYWQDYPVISVAAAHMLVEIGIKMVGMDSPSPDNYPFPVHKILLGAEILIIEMMTNLEQLIGIESFEVIALPPKFDTAGSFARVIAAVR